MKEKSGECKTIIIISTRQIIPTLKFIKKHQGFRFVLVYAFTERKMINELGLQEYFQEMYQVNAFKNGKILTPYSYDDLVLVVQKELEEFPPEKLIITTQDEGNTIVAAKLRDKFNLIGSTESQNTNFRNKESMKQLLKESNLRVPNSEIFFDQSYDDLVEGFNLPFIIKPTESAGSDGVNKITSQDDFNFFVAKRYSSGEEFEVEEYIDGVLYHVDTVLFDNKIHFAYACEYANPLLNFQHGKTIGSKLLLPESELSIRLIEFTIKCLKSFGFPDGCQHTELFVTQSGEIIFLESAARVPGLDTNEMYDRVFGVSPLFLELALLTNTPMPSRYPYDFKGHCFWALLPKIEGKIKRLNIPKIDSVCLLNWKVKEADELEQAKSNLDIAGHMLVSNDSYEKLCEDFEYIRNFKGITAFKE